MKKLRVFFFLHQTFFVVKFVKKSVAWWLTEKEKGDVVIATVYGQGFSTWCEVEQLNSKSTHSSPSSLFTRSGDDTVNARNSVDIMLIPPTDSMHDVIGRPENVKSFCFYLCLLTRVCQYVAPACFSLSFRFVDFVL